MNSKVLFGFMRFSDFLSESLKPKQVDYGTDLINKKWQKLNMDFIVTYFKSGSSIYVVLFRHGHVGFGVNLSNNIDLDEIKTFYQLEEYFSFKPKAAESAFKIFNQVIYVIVEGIKKFKWNEIYFNGSTDALKKLYSFMGRNRDWNETIRSLGYKYSGYESGKEQNEPVHIYKRIN